MTNLSKAISLFENDLDLIDKEVTQVITEEMKEESNRRELDILEGNLGSTGDSKSFRDFYSMKMIRRKSDFITNLSYTDFINYFTDENELNNVDNFARNIMDFLSMARSSDINTIFPEGKRSIKERIYALMSVYLDEGMGEDLNFQQMYNIILVTYIDLFIFYNKSDLIKGLDISKNKDNVIQSLSDSVINEFLNEVIKAMDASGTIKESASKLPFRMNPSSLTPDKVNEMLIKQVDETSKDYEANPLLVKTIFEYQSNMK
ncbi:hypothetical protein [Staphylococcus phage vB_StaM_SA1]|nr:hypothetical protein [Staphylococcus phage vB_StaM_SA1]